MLCCLCCIDSNVVSRSVVTAVVLEKEPPAVRVVASVHCVLLCADLVVCLIVFGGCLVVAPFEENPRCICSE